MTEPPPSAREENGAPMTAEDAVRRMASVTAQTRGLRTRTEGLTLLVWGIVLAASYLTIIVPILGGGGGPEPRPPFDPKAGGPPATMFFASRVAPLVWYGIGAVATIAIWHSASLSFQTGLSTPRLVAVFGAWIAVFLVTVILLAYVEGGNPRSWHLFGWAVVIGLLAAVNPLRFTPKGRAAAGVVAAVALAAGLYAQLVDLGGRDVGFLSGVALGAPAILAGLFLMFRG